ncbi:MAG: primosomal protein N' [Gammaproteobacteria bacterium]|nr:primosomal protein N' [Gammaproteobacteria bacterium]
MSGRSVVVVAVFAPLRQTFDYRLPKKFQSVDNLIGTRVLVPLGRSTRVGVVLDCKSSSEVAQEKLKALVELLDEHPLLDGENLKLARWAARYYHHPLGEVIAAMLPTRLRRRRSLPPVKPHAWQITASGKQGLATLGRNAGRQKEVLRLLDSGPFAPKALASLEFAWRPVIKRLVAKAWIEQIDCDTAPVPNAPVDPGVVLTKEQDDAAQMIIESFSAFKAIVLQGVTGSGKTEVYLAAVECCLDRGGQSLVLVPEIGLTKQLVERFQARFGDRVGIIHSGLTDLERASTWMLCMHREIRVLIGTRSAVWVPMPDLALVVVDEEHDQSYKQQEGFRYSARDIATVRAQQGGFPVVLGSATPSLESLANVERGKYARAVISSRPRDIPMPLISCVDVRGLELTAGLSDALIDAIRTHLDRGEQALLFLNRRGYSPLLICRNCGEPQRCDRCDAYVVFHKALGVTRCHHCDRQWHANRRARCCEEANIAQIGLGTERIEEAITELFPDKRVRRLDRDSVRRKGYYEEVITAVAAGEVDILIGTQMVAKGLDFAGVTLVGVIDADSRLYSVDFRADERLAQLLLQVAGRAGRTQTQGRVLIQTHHPHHPVLRRIIDDGYNAYAEAALRERKQAGLPPYSAMVILRAESAKPTGALDFLRQARGVLVEHAVARVEISYPIPALMERRAGKYRALVVIRASRRSHTGELISDHLERLEDLARQARVRWSLDIDPQDTL